MDSAVRFLGPLALCAVALSGSCREGESNQALFNPIVAPVFANQGCNGTGMAPAAPVVRFTDGALIGAGSQIVAAATVGDDELLLTGEDGSIHRLTFPAGGGAPADVTLLAAGEVETQ